MARVKKKIQDLAEINTRWIVTVLINKTLKQINEWKWIEDKWCPDGRKICGYRPVDENIVWILSIQFLQRHLFLFQLLNSLVITLQTNNSMHSLQYSRETQEWQRQAYNTYIAPQAAYCSCSGAFVSQTEQAYSLQAVLQARIHRLWPATKKPNAALVYRLVSTPVIHEIHSSPLIYLARRDRRLRCHIFHIVD